EGFHQSVKAPTRRDSLSSALTSAPLESRPVGACVSPWARTQGWRPELSNLARFGAVSLRAEIITECNTTISGERDSIFQSRTTHNHYDTGQLACRRDREKSASISVLDLCSSVFICGYFLFPDFSWSPPHTVRCVTTIRISSYEIFP